MDDRHTCYIIKSVNSTHVYIGYTVNFSRRIRQHNREIKGGAKRTSKYYPYEPVCIIEGFPNAYTAHSFEWHLQHLGHPRKRVRPNLTSVMRNLERVINYNTWPTLRLNWHTNLKITHEHIENEYL
jgi:predicted GIY-YIG superfamily endonuclease